MNLGNEAVVIKGDRRPRHPGVISGLIAGELDLSSPKGSANVMDKGFTGYLVNFNDLSIIVDRYVRINTAGIINATRAGIPDDVRVATEVPDTIVQTITALCGFVNAN